MQKKFLVLITLLVLFSSTMAFSMVTPNEPSIQQPNIPESILEEIENFEYKDNDAFYSNKKHLKLVTTILGTVQPNEIGLTPKGFRVDLPYEGQMKGKISGTVKGYNCTLIRADGVAEYEIKSVIHTDDGAVISFQAKGYIKNGVLKSTSAKFETGHPKYSWLQDRTVVLKGYTFQDKIYIKHYIVKY